MNCETKIPYKSHDEGETTKTYLCGRSTCSQVEYLDANGMHNVTVVCSIHLKMLKKEAERLGIELTIADAK